MKNNLFKYIKHFMNNKLIIFLIYFIVFSIFLIVLTIYIYSIFFRERLPRNIPFDLSEIIFYSLIFTCFIYLITKIKILILVFTTYFKKPKIIFNFYEKFYTKILLVLKYLNFDTNVFIVYLFQIIPRVLLLLIFITDVFWFKKIEIFYYFIFLSLSSLIYNLIVYYLNSILEDAIKSLEANYEKILVLDNNFYDIDWKFNPDAIYHDTCITIREYINIKYDTYINKTKIDYMGDPLSTEERLNKYLQKNEKIIENLNDDDLIFLRKYFDHLMPKILQLNIFVENNKKTLQSFFIPQIKLLILILYFCLWFYILLISIHTLKDLKVTLIILEILENYANIPNPFI